MNWQNVKNRLFDIIIILITWLTLLWFIKQYKQDQIQDKIQEEKIKIERNKEGEKKRNLINKSIIIEDSYYWAGWLIVRVRNIWERDIIWLKISTTFTNNFWEALCPRTKVSDYSGKHLLSTQETIKQWEVYTFQERIGYFIIWCWLFNWESTSNIDEIKIKNNEIYTLVFSNWDIIDLNNY